jgi:hypothetical protein
VVRQDVWKEVRLFLNKNKSYTKVEIISSDEVIIR